MISIYCKKIISQNTTILACCDKELIGKTFEENDLCIEIKESFYKGKIANEKELAAFLKESNNINLVGNKVIKVAKEQGYLNDNNIITIDGVKHAQIYKI